jgi:hypothetical protein
MSGDVDDQIRWVRDKICQEKLSDPPALLGSSWQCPMVMTAEW